MIEDRSHCHRPVNDLKNVIQEEKVIFSFSLVPGFELLSSRTNDKLANPLNHAAAPTRMHKNLFK